jgi:hypothetical protein
MPVRVRHRMFFNRYPPANISSSLLKAVRSRTTIPHICPNLLGMRTYTNGPRGATAANVSAANVMSFAALKKTSGASRRHKVGGRGQLPLPLRPGVGSVSLPLNIDRPWLLKRASINHRLSTVDCHKPFGMRTCEKHPGGWGHIVAFEFRSIGDRENRCGRPRASLARLAPQGEDWMLRPRFPDSAPPEPVRQAPRARLP